MWRPTQGARRAGRRRREAEAQKAYQLSEPWMTLVGRRRGRQGKVVVTKMETPESILRRLEFKVVRRLDGLLFGDYTGMFYGPSLDLAEVREYQPGDEVRRIDWNVTARMARLFVRQYREERELTAWLLVDLSPSMAFGTRRQLKRETAAEFAGVAGYIAARHGDKIGLLGFPGRDVYVPPRGGRVHVLRILNTLQQAAMRGDGRGLGEGLRQAARALKRRSLVFLVSDFLAADGWARPLQELARRPAVIAVWIYAPAERALAAVGVRARPAPPGPSGSGPGRPTLAPSLVDASVGGASAPARRFLCGGGGAADPGPGAADRSRAPADQPRGAHFGDRRQQEYDWRRRQTEPVGCRKGRSGAGACRGAGIDEGRTAHFQRLCAGAGAADDRKDCPARSARPLDAPTSDWCGVGDSGIPQSSARAARVFR